MKTLHHPVLCLFAAVYGVNYYNINFPDGFTDTLTGRVYVGGSLNWALFYTWIGNGYAWQFFLVGATKKMPFECLMGYTCIVHHTWY